MHTKEVQVVVSYSSWGISQEFWFITNPGYFQSLCLAKSCSDLKRIESRAESGSYVIDPDGEGGLLPIVCLTSSVTWLTKMELVLQSSVTTERTEPRWMERKTQVVTHVTSITRDLICLSWRVSLKSLHTVNNLSSMSVIIQCYCGPTTTKTVHSDGGCHVMMIRWRTGAERQRMANVHAGWTTHVQTPTVVVIAIKITRSGVKTVASSLIRQSSGAPIDCFL